MKFRYRAFLASLLSALAFPAAAHPFHGAGEGFAAGLAHPFFGLDHLLAMVAVGVWAAQIGGRAAWIVPAVFVAAMLGGAAAALAGLGVQHVEPMVAASVLVLGLLISLKWKSGALPGALLVAFFAVFHGLAHGAELPAGSSAATYMAGFALATAVLHGCGIALGRMMCERAMNPHLAGMPVALAGCWLLFAAI